MTVRYQIVVRGEFRIRHILVEGINPAISDSDACQVYPLIVHQLQFASDVWNIMASIALSSDVDVSALELGILDHEVVQKVVEVVPDGVLAPSQLPQTVDETKACADGLIDVHDVCVVVPREFIVLQLEWIFDVRLVKFEVEWPILCVQTQHGRAARASLEPDDKWIIRRV